PPPPPRRPPAPGLPGGGLPGRRAADGGDPLPPSLPAPDRSPAGAGRSGPGPVARGMSVPKVLYLGYGATGRACLADLLAAGCEIAGLLCRAGDRHPEGGPAAVFRYAHEQGLPCFAAPAPNSPSFLAEVERLAPDLLLSIQYDRILKPPLLALPRHGAWNLHFGPLPRLRGCFPTKWAILGDEPAGVTFHAIDPGIDSGDIVAQTIIPLAPGETDQSLYHKLEEAAVALFRKQLLWLRTLTPPPLHPQD